MTPEALSFVASCAGASRVCGTERVQSLWGGYGELVRVRLEDASRRTVVVKWVRPPRDAGRSSSTSDLRKKRSYEVEARFYATYAEANGDWPVPGFLGSAEVGEGRVVVLEDLADSGFGRRIGRPREASLEACLRWLAAFHAHFYGRRPDGLWEVGTYWHLATRQDELGKMADALLREKAPALDRALSGASHLTFVHGDAKAENFCFSSDGTRAAAVDFQYVGGGVGVKDVAYLLDGIHVREEGRAVDVYFDALRARLPPTVAASVEREWRALYPLAKEDFRRFLDGWRA
jgi:hypothetical protein